jgi:hypothetical protein
VETGGIYNSVYPASTPPQTPFAVGNVSAATSFTSEGIRGAGAVFGSYNVSAAFPVTESENVDKYPEIRIAVGTGAPPVAVGAGRGPHSSDYVPVVFIEPEPEPEREREEREERDGNGEESELDWVLREIARRHAEDRELANRARRSQGLPPLPEPSSGGTPRDASWNARGPRIESEEGKDEEELKYGPLPEPFPQWPTQGTGAVRPPEAPGTAPPTGSYLPLPPSETSRLRAIRDRAAQGESAPASPSRGHGADIPHPYRPPRPEIPAPPSDPIEALTESEEETTRQIGRHTVGRYKDKDVKGHHPHQQAARSNNPAYNPGEAIAVKPGTYDRAAVSARQATLNAEARRSGKPFDLAMEEAIQRDAMKAGGFTEEEIDEILEYSRENLPAGAREPTRIPGTRRGK